ncbi:MAG: hypothetical protein WDA16_12350 [Candidatus Thermoplasmatota archaeon]
MTKANLTALALCALLLAGSASAHIVTYQQAVPLTLGPYNALVQPKPDPMYANSALSMTAIFSRVADGTYVPDLPATLQLTGPGGLNKTTTMQPDGTGYVVALVAVPTAGNYTARIIVTDQGNEYANQTQFVAYPDLPIRFQTEDPNQPDPATNDSSFLIGIVTVDNITLERKDVMTDLTLILEQWSDDHRTLHSTTIVLMEHAGKGLWRTSYAFTTQGMFHLRFSSLSGGFKPDDVPILHVYARDDPAKAKKAPLPDAGLVTLALAGVALLAAARRRR